MKERIDATLPWISNRLNKGSSRRWTVGSPSQPRPRAVIVMPSWQAERYSSRLETTFLARTALRLPSAISWSMRVVLTFTIANSLATKNAVKAIKAANAANRMAMSK